MMRTPSRGGEEVRRSTPPTSPLLFAIEYYIMFHDILPMMEGGWRVRNRLPPPS
jgi:hypothetical protein